jgi:hypothetical protein
MADTELDTFLGGAGEPAPEPQPEPAPEPTPEPEEQEEAPEEEAPEPEEAPPEPTKDGRTVPLAVLEKQRKDHKERAARLEGELAELRRQFDEAKRTAQQPPPQYQPPPQPLDPVQDPAGFMERVQQVALNERLNTSELLLRKEIGPEAVDAAISEFKEAAKGDPSLFQKLYQQADPYGWMAKQVEVMKMQREIGSDPAAYKAKLRAEWEAERAAAAEVPPPVSPAARLAPSLANARSAAPRATGAWAGPTPMEDILRR